MLDNISIYICSSIVVYIEIMQIIVRDIIVMNY